jgi:photosystem II stability/assembly factor-like uncharacterized protein
MVSIAVSPHSPNEYIGGTQDNGCIKYNGSKSWTGIVEGDGGWTGYESTDPNVIYCFYVRLNLQNTLDGGVNWNYIQIASEKTVFYAPVVQDTNNPGTLFIAGSNFYKSDDYGLTWTFLASSLTGQVITALTIDSSNSQTLFAGDLDGNIFKSTNGGIKWEEVLTGVESSAVLSLEIDPTNSSRVYASFARFSQALFYASEDGGSSWVKPGAIGLPERGINVIKVHNSGGSIYVGTDAGVFYSLDQGNSWMISGNDLPNVVIWDLTFDGSSTLLAASFGRGSWKLNPLPNSIGSSTILTSTQNSSTTGIQSSNPEPTATSPSFIGLSIIIAITIVAFKRRSGKL